MSLVLGQLIYTSFPGVGFKVLASAQVSMRIQQAFIQQVVYQRWDSYSPPKLGYQAAYLYQITLKDNLFGWLYNDGLDDVGRGHVPYFLCYYLAGLLQSVQLENIFTYLHRGPVTVIDRRSLPVALETIIVPDLWSYQPARTGVVIPAGVRKWSHIALKQKKLLDLFIPVKDENIVPVEAQTRQKATVQSLERIAEVTRTQVSPRSEDVIKPLNEVVVAKADPAPTGILSQGRKSQMKVALLVGVSHYGTGFDSLPGALKDVEAMKRVLQHPEIGGFAEVKTLIDPDRQVMEEAIETLFSERQRDNLVLLYFSGHGIKDDSGKLYLSTCITRKNPQEKLVKSTAVPASFVQDIINDSQSKQQIVILDCCFSRAFAEDWPANGNSGDTERQLSAQGRAILTSSSMQDSFDQKGADCSVYTHYLVEGLETGAADLDDDGEISVDELYKYTKRRVQQAAPATQPEIYTVEAGHKIVLAQATLGDLKLRYRKEVERCASRGEISFVSRTILDILRNRLELAPEEAAAIEAGVLKPHQEYQQKLQHYTQLFIEAIQEAPIGGDTRNRLKHFQQALGLTDEDVVPVEAQIAQQIKVVQSPNQTTDWTKAETKSPSEGTTVKTNKAAASIAIPALIGSVLPAILPIRQNLSKSQKSAHTVLVHRLWLLAGVSTAALVLIGIVYGLRQRQDSQQLQAIKALMQERNYNECITVAQTISQNSNRYTDVQSLLKQCEAEVDWQNVQVQSLRGHSDTVWSVATSPDGQTLASGGADKTIKLWNLQTGELLRTLSRGSDTVWSVATSSDGQTLASGSGDKIIKLWNLRTGKLLRTLSGHSDTVGTIAISPDGQTLASGSGDKTIKLWNLRTGKLLRTLSGHSDAVRSTMISPDGQTLASGSGDKTIKLWNLQTGELLRTLSGHTSRVISVAISPDGQTLASGSNDSTIKLWNLQTGELLRTFSGHSEDVYSVAISPDGQILISGSGDKTIKLWNLQTGELLRTFSGHSEDVYSVAISPDRQTLISGDKSGVIKIWRRY